MLIFNGKKYARNNDEFTSSLFDAGGTCNGFYKRIRGGIQLFDMQRQIAAFIVDKPNARRFVVTAHRTENGRTRYMHATTMSTEKWLGIDALPTFAAVNSELANIVES